MQIFVFFLLPETKGVPIEEMNLVWTKHWWWKRYVPVPEQLPNGKPMNDMKPGNGANGVGNGLHKV